MDALAHFTSAEQLTSKSSEISKFTALPDWTVYHSPEWLRLLSQYYGFSPFYAFQKATSAESILPLIRSRRGRISSPPASMYGHMISTSEADHPALSAAQITVMHKKFPGFSIRLAGELQNALTPAARAHEIDSRVWLSDAPGKQWERIEGSARRCIRSAQKHGVVVQNSKDALPEWYRLLRLTRRRLGLPLTPLSWVKKILAQEFSGLMVAYHNNKAVAGVLYLSDDRNLHYAVPAMAPTASHLRAIDAVVWELTTLAISEQKEWLCLGGSGINNNGLRRFKKKWDAQERTIYQIDSPEKAVEENEARSLIIKHLPSGLSALAAKYYLRYFW